jgi:plastocyanin
VTAVGIAFQEKQLQATADTAFQIRLNNQDPAPHDVDIRDASGATIDDNEIVTGPTETTYDVPALPAGQYTFICSVHPVEAMTGTLTVQ